MQNWGICEKGRVRFSHQALTCTRKEVAMYVLAMGAQLSFCFSKGTKTSFPLSSLCETGVCSVIYLIW